MVDGEFSGHGVNPLFSQFEWFVKWKGLGYEHATWELGSSPFLCSPGAMILKEDFERRHREAKKGSDLSRPDKVFLFWASFLQDLIWE